jgi:hypothetical protein
MEDFGMGTIDRRGFLAGAAAAATLAALKPAATLAQIPRGQIDPAGRFGSLLLREEFEQAPRVLSPETVALFASQTTMRGIVKGGTPHRHVLTKLPTVMMQGTNNSLGFPGSCEAASFGYGLGTYTAARGFPGFDPSGGPANHISVAWLFAWAQDRQHQTKCQGSQALPYLGLLIAKGAPNASQVPYQPKCGYIDGINTNNLDTYPGIGKFTIGSYKTLPNFLNGQSTYLALLKQHINAGHAIAFSGLVANGYSTPGTAMVKGAFAPQGFIKGSGHGQLIVGYDDSLGTSGAFLIQNSFGTEWPYMNATNPLMQGRLWWTYESFFASQGFGSIAYPIPQDVANRGTVTLNSPNREAPVARIIEANRADHSGQSLAVLEVDFGRPVQLNTLRVTPPGADSPIEGAYKAPIKYGFAHVARAESFPTGRYGVELDAHTLSEDLTQHQPINYRGSVTIR